MTPLTVGILGIVYGEQPTSRWRGNRLHAVRAASWKWSPLHLSLAVSAVINMDFDLLIYRTT